MLIRKAIPLAAALACGFLSAGPSMANGDGPLHRLQTEWWQWAGSFPLGTHPLLDETGDLCALGQHGDWWYLASNFGGETTRSCTVPRGVKLLIPLVVAFCYPEEGFDTEQSCMQFVADVLDAYRPEDLVVKLDGVKQEVRDVCDIVAAPGDKVPPLARSCVVHRRADRTLFNFAIQPDTIYASEPGIWRANSARGAWAVIDTRELAPGKHRIRIHAMGQPGALIPFMNVVYHLTVAGPVNKQPL